MNITARYDEKEIALNGWTLTEFKRDINGKVFTFFRYHEQNSALRGEGVGWNCGVDRNGVTIHSFYYNLDGEPIQLD